jgi:hypothetical protein
VYTESVQWISFVLVSVEKKPKFTERLNRGVGPSWETSHQKIKCTWNKIQLLLRSPTRISNKFQYLRNSFMTILTVAAPCPPYLLLPLLSASKPDLGWLTMINLVVGNEGRVMVNWLSNGRMRLFLMGVWQGLSLGGEGITRCYHTSLLSTCAIYWGKW